jgi:hypothetical protein
MTFGYANKELEVEIESISIDANTIHASNQDGEGEFKVVLPANLKYAKLGKARIKFDSNGNVNYIRMNSAGAFKPKPFNQGFKTSRPFQQAFGGFNRANNYQSKPQIHYDSEVKVVEGISLKEYEALYNDLSKKTWITASQVFPKGDKYDAIIYTKVKKEGARVDNSSGDEEFPSEYL